MVNGDDKYRVWNRAKYDIGLKLLSGVEMNVKCGSFQILTVNDIIYIEATYSASRFFSKKLLVITDDHDQEISIEQLGLPRTADDAHNSDDEIIAHLKQSAKKIEEWVSQIDDREELHAIYTVAKSIEGELSFAKIKALKKYIPDKDWLDDLG